MSVINTMLRDLDARTAGAPATVAVADEVRPVRRQVPRIRAPFIAVVTLLMVVGIAGVYVWMKPEPYRLPTPTVIPVTQVGAVMDASAPAAQSMDVVEEASSAVVTEPVVAPPPPTVATSVAAPPRKADSRRTGTASSMTMAMSLQTERNPAPASAAASRHAAKQTGSSSPDVPAPTSSAVPPTTQFTAPAVASVAGGKVEISAADASSPANEVARAAEQQRRGELAGAEKRLRAVLEEDPSYLPARLALVGLMSRLQRDDEVQNVLKAGLAVTPTEPGLLLPYARLLTARGDAATAQSALAKASDALAGNAEYRALNATVLQQLGRSAQAATEYQAALRLAPAVGPWWIGLALAQEADGKRLEARDAYLQARQLRLSPDLAQFIENKLAKLGAD